MEAADILDLAERFFAAIESGDPVAVASFYAEGVQVWHNYDQVAQSKAENVAVLTWVMANVKGMSYTQVVRHPITGGWVQQHVLEGTAPDGTPLEVPACLVVLVEDGLITRLDEYLDTAQVAPLLR